MSYKITREFTPNRAAIVFEFDPQSEAALLRDFPWLRRTSVFAFGGRHCESSAVLYHLWSRVRGFSRAALARYGFDEA